MAGFATFRLHSWPSSLLVRFLGRKIHAATEFKANDYFFSSWKIRFLFIFRSPVSFQFSSIKKTHRHNIESTLGSNTESILRTLHPNYLNILAAEPNSHHPNAPYSCFNETFSHFVHCQIWCAFVIAWNELSNHFPSRSKLLCEKLHHQQLWPRLAVLFMGKCT